MSHSALAADPSAPGADEPAAARPRATSSAPTARVAAKAADGQEASDNPFKQRVKAPSLSGGDWINTGGPLDVQDLRGKIVILDFWTYCCINCMHILPVLKKIEHAYPNEVVVIGVHSAKFAQEKDSQSITEAVMRYEIEHPVVNDSEHAIWDRYQISSWPSFRVIDPEGYVIGASSGEIDFDTLNAFIKKAVTYYKRRGLLDETPLRFDLAAGKAKQTPLRFPGKVLADEASGRLFIADSNHDRIVVADLAGKLQDVIGGGQLGEADGDFAHASFNHPQGMALEGKTLYVADTENHMLRKVDLEKKTVTTIAGTGKQGTGFPGRPRHWQGKPKHTPLNSPWALKIHKRDLYIAMAGPHQIWRMPLDESTIGPYAGNGREDIVDGPLSPAEPYEEGFASFAQPSGLAADEHWLYVADSEGSSIRAVPFNPRESVRTVIGTAGLQGGRLFTFGDQDGPQGKALLQHPLGLTYARDVLYVADTYNSKIKIVDPKTRSVKTLVGGAPGDSDEPARFREPTGISHAAGKLYVADTNNHKIRVVDLDHDNAVSTLTIEGLAAPEAKRAESKPSLTGAEQVKVEPVSVRAVDGAVRIAVSLKLPKGYKINPEAPLRYMLEASGDDGPLDRAALGKWVEVPERAKHFEIKLPATKSSGQEHLKLSLVYYYCLEGPSGICKTAAVIWDCAAHAFERREGHGGGTRTSLGIVLGAARLSARRRGLLNISTGCYGLARFVSAASGRDVGRVSRMIGADCSRCARSAAASDVATSPVSSSRAITSGR